MRNFAILLFLLNLVYLIWNTGPFNKQEGEVEFELSSIISSEPGAGLLLLSELEAGSLFSPLVESGSIEELGPTAIVEQFSDIGGSVSITELTVLLDEEPLICASIGMFFSAEAGENMAFALADLGYSAQILQAESEAVVNYWLHMPPFNSRAAVSQRLAELQEKNIDSYIITDGEGELSQGISLGLFTQRDLALALQSRLAAQGYPSRIQEVERSNTEIQVIIDGLSGLDFVAIQSLELLKVQSELKLQEKLCETIAPEL